MDSKRCLDLVVDFLNEEFDSFQCFLEEQDIESTEAEGIIDNIKEVSEA